MHAELARATAASDLSHLAVSCFETVGASVDDVVDIGVNSSSPFGQVP